MEFHGVSGATQSLKTGFRSVLGNFNEFQGRPGTFRCVPWKFKGFQGCSMGFQEVPGTCQGCLMGIHWCFIDVPGCCRGFQGFSGALQGSKVFQGRFKEFQRHSVAFQGVSGMFEDVLVRTMSVLKVYGGVPEAFQGFHGVSRVF